MKKKFYCIALIILLSLTGCSSSVENSIDETTIDNEYHEEAKEGTEESTKEDSTNNTIKQDTYKYGSNPMNILNGGVYAEDENFVYMEAPDSNLYKIDIKNNNEHILISEEEGVRYINVMDDWIYYVSTNKIFKITTEGKERTQLTDGDVVHTMQVVNDWIYYFNDGRGIYKIKLDGSERTKVLDLPHNNMKTQVKMAVIEDWIYYTTSGREDTPLYKVSIDGGVITEVINDNIISYFIDLKNNYIYYANINGLYRLQEGAKEVETIMPFSKGAIGPTTPHGLVFAFSFIAVDDWIYFNGGIGVNTPIYKVKTIDDGSSAINVLDANGEEAKGNMMQIGKEYLVIKQLITGEVLFHKLQE